MKSLAYSFNTDLLLNEADRIEAARRYPLVAFALNHEQLRQTFLPIDQRANISKRRSRRWGVIAVFLAVIALTLAGAEVLYHDWDKSIVRLFALIGAVGGIASVVIGFFGIMFREKKQRWLADRLTTERLRQFHFQYLTAHADEIVKAAESVQAQEEYQRARDASFAQFSTELLNSAPERLRHIAHAEEIDDGLLFSPERTPGTDSSEALSQLFEAYKELRISRQISYSDLILTEKGGDWKYSPMKQARLFSRMALFCVMGILVLHGLVLIGAIGEIYWMKGKLVHVGAIVLAVIALGARTLEEGFQPETEIERMRQYRVSLKRIARRFDEATHSDEKTKAMTDLEKLSYEEMVLFLKTNYEAEFVM